jgi:hypothetical protein
MKLIIDRKKWLRGEGFMGSRLLRSGDNKKCCVGFYANALGFADEQIRDSSTLAIVDKLGVCDWKTKPDMDALYITNDARNTSDSFKERQIKRLFAKHGVKVEFVN